MGFIDVDVVRGSLFPKAKPRHGWMAAVRLGLLRVAFAPFYWDYWLWHTSFRVAAYIMFHFFLQFIQVVSFLLTNPQTSRGSQDDVVIPCLLALCLGVLHAHITASHGSIFPSSGDVPYSSGNVRLKESRDSISLSVNTSMVQHSSTNYGDGTSNYSGTRRDSGFEKQESLRMFVSHLGTDKGGKAYVQKKSSTYTKTIPDGLSDPLISKETASSEDVYLSCASKLSRHDQNESFKKVQFSDRPHDATGTKTHLTNSVTHLSVMKHSRLDQHDNSTGTSRSILANENRLSSSIEPVQLADHRPIVPRRRRNKNSFSSKYNGIRGHEADIEESDAEHRTDRLPPVYALKPTSLSPTRGTKKSELGDICQGLTAVDTDNASQPKQDLSTVENKSRNLNDVVTDAHVTKVSDGTVGKVNNCLPSNGHSRLFDCSHFGKYENHNFIAVTMPCPGFKDTIQGQSSSLQQPQQQKQQPGIRNLLSISCPNLHSSRLIRADCPDTTNTISSSSSSLSLSSTYLCDLGIRSNPLDSIIGRRRHSLGHEYLKPLDRQTRTSQLLDTCTDTNPGKHVKSSSRSSATISSSSSASVSSFRSFLPTTQTLNGLDHTLACNRRMEVELGTQLEGLSNGEQAKASMNNGHLDQKTRLQSGETRLNCLDLKKFSKHLSHSTPDLTKPILSFDPFGQNPKPEPLITDESSNQVMSKLDDLQTKRDEFEQNESKPTDLFENGATEDTITTMSRQRAKFLQLFLLRANIRHSRNKISTNLPDFLPLFRGSGTHTLSSPISLVEHHNRSCALPSTADLIDSCMQTSTQKLTDLSLNMHESRSKPCTDSQSFMVSGYTRRSNNKYSNSSTRSRSKKETRGQTASETEYDRINSDVGSDFDSSSGPEDVEVLCDCSPNLEHWKSAENGPELDGRLVNTVSSFQCLTLTDELPSKMIKLPSGTTNSSLTSTSRRPWFVPKTRIPHFRPNPVFQTHHYDDSRSSSLESSPSHHMEINDRAEIEQPDLNSSLVSPTTYPDTSLSNAEQVVQSIKHFDESINTTKTTKTAQDYIRTVVSNSKSRSGKFDSLSRSGPKKQWSHDSHQSAPSSSTTVCADTVRCHVWVGDQLSKLNLTMLDIGKNVIHAVERQHTSSDYIVLACIATFVLPLLAVIFHSGFTLVNSPMTSSHTSPKSTGFTSNPTTNSSNPSVLGELLSFNLSSVIHTNSDSSPLPSNSIIQLHLNALLHLVEHIWSILWAHTQYLLTPIMIEGHDIATLNELVRTGNWRLIGHLKFWYFVSGRWFWDWITEPDLQGRLVVILGFLLRFNVYGAIFFFLCIAERTFQQRLLYAKYFFSLTSGRRALKYRVPQFRLNKVGHIKCWLMLRSYLKKRGPQRSVETIIAAAFYIAFVFGFTLCAQMLSKARGSIFVHLTNWDILGVTFAIAIFLHRFILLGTKITKKYRNFSVLITEQINLYLSMEKKPHKKDDLMLTFQVLRLVESLLKEVDGPFRVCGWSLNPLVYNIFKLVLLSCFSTLLSESLGFKLKLYKLKLNPANW